MENEFEKGKDVLKDIGEGLSEFGKSVGQKFNDLFDNLSNEGEPRGDVNIRTDVYETDTHYVIDLELPGVDKKQVKIAATDNILSIKGVKTPEEGHESHTHYHRERRFGNFIRSFELPGGIKLENIKATFNNGLLTVQFPKLKPKKKKPESDATEIDIE